MHVWHIEGAEMGEMCINALEMLRRRHSVRDYSCETVPDATVNSLKAELTMINTHEAGLYFQMRLDDPDPFKGFLRSYGMFRNARNYVACVVDTSYPDTVERAGYFAERFVIKAVSLGLGTCFVGGTYSADKVNVPLRAGQRILFLILFGIPSPSPRGVMKAVTGLFKGKPRGAEAFFAGTQSEYKDAVTRFPNLEAGLEGVACAPSWMNGRPVRIGIRMSDGIPCICASVPEGKEHNLIDLGIAKYNFAAAAEGDWEWGNGARFYPSDGG